MADMPYFDRLITMKLATGPFRPIFHEGNMFTFEGVLQQGIDSVKTDPDAATTPRHERHP